MFQSGSRNQQVRAIVSNRSRQLPPSARSGYVYIQNSFGVPVEDSIQPDGQFVSKLLIASPLLSNPSFDLSHGHRTQIQIRRSSSLDPANQTRMSFSSSQSGQYVSVNQKHHISRGRADSGLRSNSRSSCGVDKSSSGRLGAFTLSSRRSRSYSSTDSTTTAGRPRLVTSCGAPDNAALTTALKRFFASCSDQSVMIISG